MDTIDYMSMSDEQLNIQVAKLRGYTCLPFKSKYAWLKDIQFVIMTPQNTRCALGITEVDAWRCAAQDRALLLAANDTKTALSLFDSTHHLEIIIDNGAVIVYAGTRFKESYEVRTKIVNGDIAAATARALTIAYLRWRDTQEKE